MPWAGKSNRHRQAVAKSFLDKWKDAAELRRSRLEELVAGKPMSARRKEELLTWQKSITAKRAWLAARLEHLDAVEKILNDALKDQQ